MSTWYSHVQRQAALGSAFMNELRKAGLFWLAGVLILVAGCRERPRVYAEVDQAHGLQVCARVSFRGVPIDDVEKIAFKGSVQAYAGAK